MSLFPTLFEPRRLPLGSGRRLLSELERLIGDEPAFSDSAGQFSMDIQELDDKYVIEADMPGVKKDNIDITLQDHLLTIQVKKEEEKETKEKNYISRERFFSTASRSVTLPHAANEDDVEASLKDGVLKVNVKKQNNGKRKRISVK